MARGFFGDLLNKVRTQAQAQQDAETTGGYNQYMKALPGTIRAAYEPAYADISAQVAPQFSQARQFLAANPYQGQSGTTARLNRSLLTGSYGLLGRAMAGTAGQGAMQGQDLLGSLIQRRIAAQQALRQAQYEAKLQKDQQGSGLGGALGGFAGSVLGPVGTAVGTKIGSMF